VQDPNAAGLLDGFAFSGRQLYRRGRERLAGKNRALRLIDGGILNCKGGWSNQRGNGQSDSNSGFHPALEIESDPQPHVIFLVFLTENVIVMRGEFLVFLAESVADW